MRRAFAAAADADKFSLGAPPLSASGLAPALRARVRLHRLITDLRSSDFYSEVDEADGRTWLLPAADGADARGASFYAVLSTDTAVVAAAHALKRPEMRHRGCASRALDALPPACVAVFDRVGLAGDGGGGGAIIAHVTVAPSARMPLHAFAAALDAWPAANCRIEANADVEDEDSSDDGAESGRGDDDDDDGDGGGDDGGGDDGARIFFGGDGVGGRDEDEDGIGDGDGGVSRRLRGLRSAEAARRGEARPEPQSAAALASAPLGGSPEVVLEMRGDPTCGDAGR